MTHRALTVEPVAQVIGGRREPTDDYWGGTRSILRIDNERFDEQSTVGLDAFSHLEVVFFFHLSDQRDLNLGARRPGTTRRGPRSARLATGTCAG